MFTLVLAGTAQAHSSRRCDFSLSLPSWRHPLGGNIYLCDFVASPSGPGKTKNSSGSWISLLVCLQWRLRTCSGEDINVQLQKGVWLCCVRGLGGLCCGGNLQFCNIFHIVLLVVSHEQLECKESLFLFWSVRRNSST